MQDAILSTQSIERRDLKPMVQGPKRVVSVLLSLIVLSAGFLDYWSYSQAFHQESGIWMDVVSGTAKAPGQYRIGVIDTAYFLSQETHLTLRLVLAALDVVGGFIAVFALFLVLRRSAVYRRASQGGQWFGAASFVVLVQFYLAWLLWYQKPETLPTVAMLALALLLLTVRLPLENRLGTVLPVGGLLVLAAAQAFVRADVAFALHAGVLLVCLTAGGKEFALPRWLQAGTSLVAVMLILGIQYWLIKKVYPLATYGDLSVVQLLYNMKSIQSFVPFVLFMTPVGWTAAMVARRRYAMEAGEAGIFAAAVIFFAMWVTLGRIKEVRIFLPFALALAPLTVRFAMQGFVGQVRES
jgi:hypothetical protein